MNVKDVRIIVVKRVQQAPLPVVAVGLALLLGACSLIPATPTLSPTPNSTPSASINPNRTFTVSSASPSDPATPTVMKALATSTPTIAAQVPQPSSLTENVTRSAKPLQIEQTTDVSLSGGTTRFDYQSMDPKTGLLFIAHLGSSIVHVYDTRANRIVADMPGISDVHGVLAVPELGKVYAAATGDNQVAVIDETTLKVMARTEGGDYPDGIAYDPNTHKVYVSDEHGSSDTVIDTRTDKRVGSVDIGGEAGNTQFDPISGHIFVAVQTRNQLVAIDTSTDKVIGRYDLPGCDHDHGLLIDAPQHRAFVACDGNAKLLIVDMQSMKVIGEQSVGNDPDVLALDSGWHRLYVSSESGVVSIFDVSRSGGSVQKIGDGQLDPSAHTVAIDQQTHLVYLPLENINGKPLLRIILYSAP